MVLNELEARVAKIWADSLEHMEKIGPNDSFFDLGGDSLSMMIVLFQIGEQLGIELTQAELLQAHTLRQFCAVIEAARTDLPARGQS
jgi:acyl carrier protein